VVVAMEVVATEAAEVEVVEDMEIIGDKTAVEAAVTASLKLECHM
jgi:hypothetical protein